MCEIEYNYILTFIDLKRKTCTRAFSEKISRGNPSVARNIGFNSEVAFKHNLHLLFKFLSDNLSLI